MPHKSFLSSEEHIVCPQCHHKFELGEGITEQTIEKYEQDFEIAMKERAAELHKGVEQDAEQRLARSYNTQLDVLNEQLRGSQEAVAVVKVRVEQVQQETKAKTFAAFEAARSLKGHMA